MKLKASVIIPVFNESNTIEEILDEVPDVADEFEISLRSLTLKRIQREGSHKLFKVIDALYDVVSDPTKQEDGGPSVSDRVKSASTLAKLLDPPKQSKKGDQDNEYDDLLKQLEDDLKKEE